jgi:hypothetical protein
MSASWHAKPSRGYKNGESQSGLASSRDYCLFERDADLVVGILDCLVRALEPCSKIIRPISKYRTSGRGARRQNFLCRRAIRARARSTFRSASARRRNRPRLCRRDRRRTRCSKCRNRQILEMLHGFLPSRPRHSRRPSPHLRRILLLWAFQCLRRPPRHTHRGIFGLQRARINGHPPVLCQATVEHHTR